MNYAKQLQQNMNKKDIDTFINTYSLILAAYLTDQVNDEEMSNAAIQLETDPFFTYLEKKEPALLCLKTGIDFSDTSISKAYKTRIAEEHLHLCRWTQQKRIRGTQT